ncbi:protein translocase subunit SecF [Oceanidesulfovibrio indonesiensis]|uniref:Protein-export membrane protein SecF n=1 Tax=Oceanidesulfovibrio indonesiensis TaxID=54767 RepID=A0A7M3MG94_9BACT|nr:protein translocase subunit SecF [Oceanidesulfovibrio indonesiensis]TVM18342.1 protein translocase subunit SecF [Oceanidesulfovibrio indonesiensis]
MGLNILKKVPNVNFIGYRKVAFLISAALLVLGIGSLVVKGGPSYGIDFAGGINVQLKFQNEIELPDLRDALETIGHEGMTVQRFGMEGDNEYLMRLVQSDIETDVLRQEIDAVLAEAMAEAGHEIQRVEMVGPKVGADLRQKALEAMFYAVLLIAIYISGRFEQRWWAAGIMAASLSGAMYLLGLIGIDTGFLTIIALLVALGLCWRLKLNYALGAVVALVHDVFITVGIFSLLNKEFDLTIVAALLTIIGYSLNDTIIVFDRIRENLRNRISKDFGEVINRSINQTLSRTVLTSGTTLLVVASLFIFGGGVIHDFALALLIGIGVGTYSSIFVASPILLVFQPQEEEPNAPAPAEA